MATAKGIDIIIEENGDVTFEGQGPLGPDCKKLTKALEEASGTVINVVEKAEYHQSRPALKKVTA